MEKPLKTIVMSKNERNQLEHKQVTFKLDAINLSGGKNTM